MTVTIHNNGKFVTEFRSDAEAVRWFAEEGNDGDYIAETGEYLFAVARDLDLADD